MLSRDAQAAKYFAQRYDSPTTRLGIPRKRLVKMLYLADLLAREHWGAQITSFEWYRYEFGPYHHSIKTAIKELEDAEVGKVHVHLDGDNVSKLLQSVGPPIVFEFSPKELEILRYVADTYLHWPMEELLNDVVYPSTPMQKTSGLNEVLPMEAVNNRARNAVGFDLDDLLRAETEVRAGKVATDF